MLKPHEFLNLGKLWDTFVKPCFWGGAGVGHCDLKKGPQMLKANTLKPKETLNRWSREHSTIKHLYHKS